MLLVEKVVISFFDRMYGSVGFLDEDFSDDTEGFEGSECFDGSESSEGSEGFDGSDRFDCSDCVAE